MPIVAFQPEAPDERLPLLSRSKAIRRKHALVRGFGRCRLVPGRIG